MRLLRRAAEQFSSPWPYVALLYVWVCWRFLRAFIYPSTDGTVFGLADDVYISACYGRSLADGHGLAWYPGAPRVEGFSNPTWVLLLAALHLLPGFDANTLGLYVFVANALLLCATVLVFYAILARSHAGASRAIVWQTAPLLLGGGALCYWASEGFEVVLVSLAALLGMLLALQPLSGRRALLFGALLGFGIWTRLDALIYWTAPLCVALAAAIRERRYRDFAVALGMAAFLVGVMFVARRLYFGEWLPNTYYLKATNWPLRDRLKLGLDHNQPLFVAACLLWFPLLLAPVRRRLRDAVPAIAACFLVCGLSIVYSTYNGGDAWGLKVGHDRYTAPASMFSLLGLALVVVNIQARQAVRAVLALACGALAILPAVLDTRSAALYRDLLPADTPRTRSNEDEWIRYGKSFEKISKPGARIALCSAGAIVYFSHRGGVDLLGKVEPFVARSSATSSRPKGQRCWQGRPGHNKEDDVGVFRLREPDFSRIRPPLEFRSRYHSVRYAAQWFHVRNDTPYAVEGP